MISALFIWASVAHWLAGVHKGDLSYGQEVFIAVLRTTCGAGAQNTPLFWRGTPGHVCFRKNKHRLCLGDERCDLCRIVQDLQVRVGKGKVGDAGSCRSFRLH